jgi:hypothetical protein
MRKHRRELLIGMLHLAPLLVTCTGIRMDAIGKTLQPAFRRRVSVKNFGASGDGITDDTTSIQNAWDAAYDLGGADVVFPPGTYLFGTLTPKSAVRSIGRPGAILKQMQPSSNISTGILKDAGMGNLLDCSFVNLAFDGSMGAAPANQFNNIISINLGGGETLDRFSIEGCSFRNSQNHFIAIVSLHPTGIGRNIRVAKNRFITERSKWNLRGANPCSMDAVRIENADNYAANYGVVKFSDIDISENYAESIRTLADIKRGCRNYHINGNNTVNMYDCHHSVDGSFDGVVANNTGRMDASYRGPTTATNFIECQGERASILRNRFDGAGLTRDGVFLTDYGRPEENGMGHACVGVSVYENAITALAQHAYRSVNAHRCEFRNNYAESAGGNCISIESGTGRTNGTSPLISQGCAVSGNRCSKIPYCVFVRGINQTVGRNTYEDALCARSR